MASPPITLLVTSARFVEALLTETADAVLAPTGLGIALRKCWLVATDAQPVTGKTLLFQIDQARVCGHLPQVKAKLFPKVFSVDDLAVLRMEDKMVAAVANADFTFEEDCGHAVLVGFFFADFFDITVVYLIIRN